jgi:ABC-type nitrate/sulfonate/bicarbonate transport system ATPase subunit
MERDSMIRLQGVSKSFDSLNVLNSITFEIRPLETAGILGPSGSGKTTLLRIIAGILKPDSGTVTVDRSRIGYVFQDHRLLPWKTALDNVALGLRAQGKNRLEAKTNAAFWLDRLGLGGFYDYYPAQLSGGMQQRVSIARAFAIKPEIMLMDEPFSSLDAGLAEELIWDLKQVLLDSKATVIYVTHDLVECLSLANRLFRLTAGRIEEQDISDRSAILQKYLLARLREIK